MWAEAIGRIARRFVLSVAAFEQIFGSCLEALWAEYLEAEGVRLGTHDPA